MKEKNDFPVPESEWESAIAAAEEAMNVKNEALIPKVGVVESIRIDPPDVKTFRVVLTDGGKPFVHKPGQCAMLSIPGVGEAMFSITSSPTEEFTDFSIKRCGCLTDSLHSMEAGQPITIRGPYGRPFPVDDDFSGKDLLFVAGGIGIAPLRSVISYCLHFRERYGKIDVIYGARSRKDLVDYDEITKEWKGKPGVNVHLTIDRAEPDWDGHVGFVPDYVKEIEVSPSCVAIVCGPPVMIKFTLSALRAAGLSDERIYTTMELRMKCGIGKCGRCNIGSKYVCKDGPVFRMDELETLPDEY